MIIRIGFVGCLVSLSSSGGGDWYVSTLAFVEGWNVVALALSLVGGNVGGGTIGGEIVGEVAGRGAIVDCWFC